MFFYQISLIDMMQAVAIITGVCGHLLIANQNVKGYFLWIAGNFATIFLSYEKQLYGMVFLFCLYTLLSIWAIVQWTKKSDKVKGY